MSSLTAGTDLIADLSLFFAAVSERLERFRIENRDRERNEAPRFNVFRYINPDESRLSDVITDLLDETGQHGQGDLFLENLLEAVGVNPHSLQPPFRVKREDLTPYSNSFRRRIDITVEAGDFGIGIENKPWAAEGEDQLKDYAAHLRRKYGDRFLLVYLSGDGSSPVSLDQTDRLSLESAGRLKTLAYPTHVLEWLRGCLQECGAEHVRWFLGDLIDFLEGAFELAELREEAIDEVG